MKFIYSVCFTVFLVAGGIAVVRQKNDHPKMRPAGLKPLQITNMRACIITG